MPKRLKNRDELVEWLGSVDGVRAVVGFDSEGRTFGEAGSSKEISDEDDREILLAARSLSDVAFTGGATARAEKYQPSERIALAILTRARESVSDVPAVLRPGSKGTYIIESGADLQAALRKAIADLRELGLSRVQFEGGLMLLSEAVAAGVIDEVLVSSVSGLDSIPFASALIADGWRVTDTANFGRRWLFQLRRKVN